MPGKVVSIHAPAWGATSGEIYTAMAILGFNPRPRMGSDTCFYAIVVKDVQFQSTPPHGERLRQHGLVALNGVFQSTPPHGERQNVL